MNECYTMQNHTPQRPDIYQHASHQPTQRSKSQILPLGGPRQYIGANKPVVYNLGSDRPSPDNPVSETIGRRL